MVPIGRFIGRVMMLNAPWPFGFYENVAASSFEGQGLADDAAMQRAISLTDPFQWWG